ncbi:MAG: gliding motility-associated C-terminal domain-containing protein [Candidatus Latescibacteria bacterium]|nr:gliding motility-associated C-terminal domain-containing protein [Candidatus Latescibacterota bacterium]
MVGEDWGAWSNEYQSPGDPFKSESPRRFVQLELIFATDDPEFAPTVHSLAIEFEEALVQEALGRIEPREARPNEATRFTYSLATRALPADSGFDLLRFTLPGPVDLEAGVEVSAGATPIDPVAVEARGDSLFIALPEVIAADSLEVSFTTRLLQNAALFALDLGTNERPGLWQSVEAMSRRANIVLLPELTGSRWLIDDLAIDPPVFTPNGDGINDQVAIRFAVLKVAAPAPQVEIFDLSGHPVARLSPSSTGSLLSYLWNGVDIQGAVVPPGIYLCRIDLGAQTGEDNAVRLIGLAY